ncbi:MAG: phosphomannomutase [Desulfobulbaceae bacterium]|nr:MAG: phosphomannomutase [Desulfobulbaceae bacterium]
MKLVRQHSRPISGDTGLERIRALVEENDFSPASRNSPLKKVASEAEARKNEAKKRSLHGVNEHFEPNFDDAAASAVVFQRAAKGRARPLDSKKAYIDHLLGYVDVASLQALKVVVNSGNGCAGPLVDLLAEYLPFEFVRIQHEPDGTFPNGIPNPLLPENRAATSEAVVAHGADVGIAWDGDFDSCFFFDHHGRFIEGYYVVGLLAAAMLEHHPGAKIIHDPRLTWNTIAVVQEKGGEPILCKTGHAFIKERMRQEDAVYGGEMSAHHYFKDFAYCDSGMIPWLLVLEIMGQRQTSLADLVSEMQERFPASGEINRTLAEPLAAIRRVEETYKDLAEKVDYTDGLSMEFAHWRFNLRCSNTEPVVRLNVESRGDAQLMQDKTRELLGYLE